MNARRILCSMLAWICMWLTAEGDDYDLSKLAHMEVEKAKRDFLGLRLNYMAVPDDEKRTDLYAEAQYWISKNEKLRKHYELFFRDTPHLFKTAYKRDSAIVALGRLRAEWSVRLLFEEVMIDREGQEIAGMGKEITEEELERMARNGSIDRFVRNDIKAAVCLFKMKLKGVPATRWGEYKPEEMLALKSWYRGNKHRLDEVVKETWGGMRFLIKRFKGVSPSQSVP